MARFLGLCASGRGHAGTANALACDVALTTCNATRVEKLRPLPGNTIVPEPMFNVTHAIRINAPIRRRFPGHMADDAIDEDVALGRVLRGPSDVAAFVENSVEPVR